MTHESWMKHKGMRIMTLKTQETDAQIQGIDFVLATRDCEINTVMGFFTYQY